MRYEKKNKIETKTERTKGEQEVDQCPSKKSSLWSCSTPPKILQLKDIKSNNLCVILHFPENRRDNKAPLCALHDPCK